MVKRERRWGLASRLLELVAAGGLVLGVLGSVSISAAPAGAAPSNSSWNFVTRSGDELMLNGQQYRFGGANIYWGDLDENGRTSITYPTKFRVSTALAEVADMGDTVVRCQTCGISLGNPLSMQPALGVYNETALQVDDYFIATAQKDGIRLQIPLVDNWNYYLGAYHTYLDWLGLSGTGKTCASSTPSAACAGVFYTNPLAIAAYEQWVSTLLNHVNVYTGVANKNNPTIMIWETGSELDQSPSNPSPASEFTNWTSTVSQFIKTIAPNQLVMDGGNPWVAADLSIPTVDIYSQHFYPLSSTTLASDATTVTNAGKVFVTGEYEWNDTASGTANSISDEAAIVSNPLISGDEYWSLFPQNDNFGWSEHYDGYQVHFPGDAADVGTSTPPILMGTTLSSASSAGATTIHPASVTNLGAGFPVVIDTGANQETATVAAVGTAGTNTTLAAPTAAGATKISVASVGSILSGDSVVIDTGAGQETATVASVGTSAGTATTLAASTAVGATTIYVASVSGDAAGDPILIDTGANQETGTVASVGTAAGSATTLVAPTTVGATKIYVASVSGDTVGHSYILDAGTGSQEIDTVSAVGTAAGAATTLAAAASVGATNIKVTSTSGDVVGQYLMIDTASKLETDQIVTIGTTGSGGTGVTLATGLLYAHASGASVRDEGTGVTLTSGLVNAHASGAAARDAGTGVTLTSGLVNAHASGVAVRDEGTGVTLTSGLVNAHASGVAVTDAGTGVTLTTPLVLAHAAGVPVTTSDTANVTALRNHGYAMSGLSVPAYMVPAAPVITNVEHVVGSYMGTGNLIEWQGAAGAATYVVQRSTVGPDGPWTTICTTCTDNSTPWLDAGAPNGPGIWYEVTAVNPGGVAGPVSAPYELSLQTITDPLNNFSLAYSHSADLTLDTTTPVDFQGDASRAESPTGTTSDDIVWNQPGMATFEATGYYKNTSADTPSEDVVQTAAGSYVTVEGVTKPTVLQFNFLLSTNGSTWTTVPAADVYMNGGAETASGYWTPYIYTILNMQSILPGAAYVEAQWDANTANIAELGEARITYAPAATAASITSSPSSTFVVGHGKSITISAAGSPTPFLYEVGTLPSGITFTNNANGTATLSGTPASGSSGTYPLTIGASNGVAADGMQNYTLTVLGQPTTPTTGSVTGFVSDDSSGQALSNICVYLYQVGNTSSAAYAGCTSSNGSFEIGGVSPGSYDLAFSDPAGVYATQWYTGTATGSASESGAQPITVSASLATESVDAAMLAAQAGNLVGTVTNATTGYAVPGACVYLYPVGTTSSAYSTCTASDGTYGINGIAPAFYNVVVSDPSGLYATQWFNGTSSGAASQSGATSMELPAGAQTTATVNLGLTPVYQGNVAGTITDASSSASLANICVYLYPVGTTSSAYSTCTLANGTYEMSGVTPGFYDVAFADPAGAYTTQWYTGSTGGSPSQSGAIAIEAPVGNETVTANAAMSLVPYGNVSGVVTDTSANDLANICVYLYPVGGSSSAAASCTLANGSYFISGVAPGSYDVAFADTYATGVYSTQWYTGATGGAATQSGATAVTVPAGGQTLSGVGAAMSLVPYGNVSGVVTDTSANDLANICVGLYLVGGSSPVAVTCTLVNGSYEFYGLTAGTQYDVAFYDPNYVYTTQWYNGAATQAGATAVTVPAGGQTLSGIGAAMAG